MEQIPARELERTMKVQDVILKALAKEDYLVAGGRDFGRE